MPCNSSLALPDPLPTATRGRGSGGLNRVNSFSHPKINGGI